MESIQPETPDLPRAATGVEGLDDILAGGITPHRLYLVEGTPGTGKTTLALQFLLEGLRHGERGLYITLSETASELRAVAPPMVGRWRGSICSSSFRKAEFAPDQEQTLLHPSELELGETVRGVMERVEALRPKRVVLDSLSELRLLAQNPLRYRRQILALKHFFSSMACTVLVLDDRTSEPGDLQLHSIAHGVISLEQAATGFGAERRRLRVVKMRGIKYSGGYHDFAIGTGGLSVYPRLIASEHPGPVGGEVQPTGRARARCVAGRRPRGGNDDLAERPRGRRQDHYGDPVHGRGAAQRPAGGLLPVRRAVADLLHRSAALGMDLEPYIDPGYAYHPADRPGRAVARRIRHRGPQLCRDRREPRSWSSTVSTPISRRCPRTGT